VSFVVQMSFLVHVEFVAEERKVSRKVAWFGRGRRIAG
jgi:hypothetical protein